MKFSRDSPNIALGELCLRFFIKALVFILSEKNMKLLLHFLNIFSKFYETKTRTYRQNLRHVSLHQDLNYVSLKIH